MKQLISRPQRGGEEMESSLALSTKEITSSIELNCITPRLLVITVSGDVCDPKGCIYR